ncbi:MAG: serine/threonine-protein phosphatase [Planctomycetaceae bacterium]|nr:MAG: serine/threonine-protein phosphatase [Planctomycetaceae bacterium]
MPDLDNSLDQTEQESPPSDEATSMVVRVQIGAASHVGKVRQNNEDQYAVIRRRRSREALMTSLPNGVLFENEEEAYILLVADGMGGAAFGEVASELALRTIWELEASMASWPDKVDDNSANRLLEDVDDVVQLIHRRIRQRASQQPELVGMGTTLTAVISIGLDVFVVHVGDSRAYHVDQDQIQQITRDHTLAQQLVDAGIDASRTQAFQHVLTNCLGADARQVTSEVHHLLLNRGDYLVLCTDGLSDLVSADEIHSVIADSEDSQQACDRLVDLALERGGKDNITVVIACFGTAE